MCYICDGAMKVYFPDVKNPAGFLIGATAYPVADGAYVAKQVADLHRKSGGNADIAFCIADQECEIDMKRAYFNDWRKEQRLLPSK